MSISESLLYEVQDGAGIEIRLRDGKLFLELSRDDGDTGVHISAHISEGLSHKIIEAFNDAAVKGVFKEIWDISDR